MKLIKHLFFVFALVALVCSCKNENKEASTNSKANQAGENRLAVETGCYPRKCCEPD